MCRNNLIYSAGIFLCAFSAVDGGAGGKQVGLDWRRISTRKKVVIFLYGPEFAALRHLPTRAG